MTINEFVKKSGFSRAYVYRLISKGEKWGKYFKRDKRGKYSIDGRIARGIKK